MASWYRNLNRNQLKNCACNSRVYKFWRRLIFARNGLNFKPSCVIAGELAIDLFVDKITWTHQGIEIVVLRKDRIALHNYFKGLLLQKKRLCFRIRSGERVQVFL